VIRKRRLQRNILTNQTILNPALVIAQKTKVKKSKKKQKIEKSKNICALYQIDLLDVEYCVNMYFVINFLS